jgi:hypothetical protein
MQNMRWLLAIVTIATIVTPTKAEPSSQRKGSDKELLVAIRGLELGTDFRYFSAYTDLNGDGRKEVIVFLIGPHTCGSGGCPTVIFSPQRKGKGYRLVTYIELTRPPIVAAKSKTKGWRDLIVFVQGGGILEGYNMLLPFDGASYPESPFLDPARSFKGKVNGEVLITRHSYEEGKVLEQP